MALIFQLSRQQAGAEVVARALRVAAVRVPSVCRDVAGSQPILNDRRTATLPAGARSVKSRGPVAVLRKEQRHSQACLSPNKEALTRKNSSWAVLVSNQ